MFLNGSGSQQPKVSHHSERIKIALKGIKKLENAKLKAIQNNDLRAQRVLSIALNEINTKDSKTNRIFSKLDKDKNNKISETEFFAADTFSLPLTKRNKETWSDIFHSFASTVTDEGILNKAEMDIAEFYGFETAINGSVDEQTAKYVNEEEKGMSILEDLFIQDIDDFMFNQ